MKYGHEVAKILVDAFEDAGVSTKDMSFYDMMFMLWLWGEKEAYDLVVKALGKDVIAEIQNKLALEETA